MATPPDITDPLIPLVLGTRVTLNAVLLRDLGWDKHAPEDFNCHGFYRTPSELLCAPEWLTAADGRHPFADAQTLASQLVASPVVAPTLANMISTTKAATRNRLTTFDAKWSSGAKQLNLYIGRPAVLRLALAPEGGVFDKAYAYAFPAYGVLILSDVLTGGETFRVPPTSVGL